LEKFVLMACFAVKLLKPVVQRCQVRKLPDADRLRLKTALAVTNNITGRKFQYELSPPLLGGVAGLLGYRKPGGGGCYY
jgi:hypothetical protein